MVLHSHLPPFMIPAELENTPYLNLGTFRKSGQVVNTPVWFAHNGHSLFVLSAGEAGKVKRLRNSTQACVAACNYHGSLEGEWHQASATLLSKDEISQTHKLFTKKYGWQMRVFDSISRVGGRYSKRAYIRIEIAP